MFKKLFAAMGVGSAEVDTRLHSNVTTPGGKISGEVIIRGGQVNQEIEQLSLFLVTQAEVESGDHEHRQSFVISRWQVARSFKIFAGEQSAIPFELPIHLETPITDLAPLPVPQYSTGASTGKGEAGNGGSTGKGLFAGYRQAVTTTDTQPLTPAMAQPTPQPVPHNRYGDTSMAMRGTKVWIHTGLEIDNGVDASDRDMLSIRPTAPISRFLAALESLGFVLRSADVEQGSLRGHGFQSTIGCYQELEYSPAFGQSYSIKQLEVSFVSRPYDTGVLLEVDRRFRHGDSFNSLLMQHHNYQQVNWEQEIRRVLRL